MMRVRAEPGMKPPSASRGNPRAQALILGAIMVGNSRELTRANLIFKFNFSFELSP
jgi:hypothetical protein